MSVEKLLSALSKEGDLKEKSILEEAREKARSLLSDARKNAQELDSQIIALKKALESRRESLHLAHQKLNDRKKTIRIQNRILSDIFQECSTLHRRFMETPAYADFLREEYGRILKEMGSVEEVRADPKTATLLKGMGHFSIVEDEGMEGGFVAVTEKGTRKISCLFSLRLQKKWKEVAPRFVKLIAETETENILKINL